MYHGVTHVEPQSDYKLILTFTNGERRCFNMLPYLDIGIFRELKDVNQFRKVRVCFDTIAWENEADMDPEVLYELSKQLD